MTTCVATGVHVISALIVKLITNVVVSFISHYECVAHLPGTPSLHTRLTGGKAELDFIRSQLLPRPDVLLAALNNNVYQLCIGSLLVPENFRLKYFSDLYFHLCRTRSNMLSLFVCALDNILGRTE